MSSRYALRARSYALVFLMITMAQVGYTMNGFDNDAVGSLESIEETAEVPTNNDVDSLFVGGGHSCVITEGDMMKCWGNNTAGQLGIGNSESMGDEVDEMGEKLPYLNLGTDLIPESAALGMAHTCVLFSNNSVKCFGDVAALGIGYSDSTGAGDGYLETGDYLPFWPAPTGRNVSQIAAGWYHTCVVLDDGSMTCWGENSKGQLGMGNTTDLGQQSDQVGDSASYVPLPSGVTVSDMALGADHTCILYDTGDVACWGGNDYGQLGIGSTEDILDESAETLTNISFPSGRYAIDITAGEGFTCALLDNNQAICWGLNDVGQLGLGHSNNYGDSGSEPISSLSSISLTATGSTTIRTIDAGYDHVCVALNNNYVKCWGGNLFGHLGIGVSGPNAHRGDDVNEMGGNLPSIALGSSPNPLAVEVGENFACMLKQAGNMPVKCWGTSVNGRLGYENTEALGDSSSDNLANVVDLGLDSEYESVDCGGADPFLHDTNILPAEELDNAGNGRKIDIAFRSDGCPGVLYTDDNADNLRFAMYDNGIWVYEYPYASAAGSSVGDLSLLFDENDIPHLAWSDIGYDTSGDDTHYATKANGKWNHVQLSNLAPNTYNTEIIQFDDGDLEIIAAPFTNYRLYSELCSSSDDCLDSSDWSQETVSNDLTIRQGFDSSIGPAGDAWLSYTLSSGSGTNFLDVVSKSTGGSWTSTVHVAQNSSSATSAVSDIEVAVDGTVHAVYLHEDYATDGIMYTSCSGGWSDCNSPSDWSFIPVPHVTNDTFSLAVDYDLVPHIFFNASSSLKFIKLVDGTWSSPVEVLNLGVSEIEANFHESGKLWMAARIQSPSNTLWVVEGASFGGNGMSIDIDGDGWSGIEEYRCGSDMIDSDSVPTDADFDGICDAEDEIHDLFTYGEARTISVGEDFACGLTAQPDDGSNSNTLYCWGSDSHSQLGNSVVTNHQHMTNTAFAVPVLDLPSSWHAVDVDVGARHACAIGVDGDVYCWGDNAHGQLGINSTLATSLPVEVQLPANTRAMSISAGSQHTCVVTTDGKLYCWGDSSNQQLGEYFLANSSGYVEETFSSSNWLDTTYLGDVYIGQYATNARDNDWTYSTDNGGTLKWDLTSNYYRYNEFSFSINALSDGYITFDTKSDMGSGDYICLYIDSSCGQGWYHPPNTWTTRNHSFTAGTHKIQFVGNNQPTSSGFNDAWIDNVRIHAGYSLEEGGIVRAPSQVSLGSMIVSEVTTGDDHTCVVTSTGAAYCWGDNDGSTTMTLGNSSFTGTNSSSPLLVDLAGTGSQYSGSQPPRFGLLNAGAGATCGTLLTNASTICWGKSSAGTSILGGGNPSSAASFAYANDKLAVGNYHACAIDDNGDVKCWGRDNAGQLGNGGGNTNNTNAPPSTAIDLGTGRTAVALSSGNQAEHSCAILDNGELKCWGKGGRGQLGMGTNTNLDAPSSTAIDLGTGRTAVSVSTSFANTCAILDNGELKCWGYDDYGQLGDGGSNDNTNEPSSTAIDLGMGRTAVAVSSGRHHTCAILDNDDLKCWGRNNVGQLGTGGNTDINAPLSTAINLGTGRTAVAVSGGGLETCAILDNFELKCWGWNTFGQLGVGSTSNRYSPASVYLGTDRTAVAIAAGNNACVILDNGDLKCWGWDQYGQVGDGGSATNRNSPVSVDLGTGRTAVAVDVNNQNACAILDNGDLKCWGWDAYGQLGDGGTNSNQFSPVLVSGSYTWDSNTGASSSSGSVSGNGTAWLVKDIRASSTGSWISDMAAIGNTVYFSANDGSNGQELWKSDGTESGTVMVKDIMNGGGGSNPSYLTAIGNTLYFSANNGANGPGGGLELWKSDGTESGTVLVKDIASGSPSSSPSDLIAVGSTLFFRANDGSNGQELWKSDGTESGTVMVQNIAATGHSKPSDFTLVGNTLFFEAETSNGWELWKSDGTATGTVMVKDINSGSSDSNPTYLTAVGNTLYFRADDGTNGMELWKSDGTATGTVMVKDIRSGSMPGAPNHLTAIGNTLYFAGNDGTNGTELWKSDGTESGTVMIKDIRSGNAGSNLVELTAVGNTLFFNAADGSSSGYELWKSDGTESGTVMVKEINPTSNSSGNSNSQSLTSFCDTLYFSANDGVHDDELWKSDGTTSGTIMVQDIFTGTSSSASSPGNFFNSIIGNHIFFIAQDGIHGEELWALSPSQITCGSSGSSSSTSTPPSIHGTFVSLNDTTSSLSVGHHHACAVVDEKILCWGEENGGELGDGGSSSSSSSTPVEVDITGLGTPIDVSVSEIGNTSCALFKKNSAYSFRCWGSDEVGAIGDDSSYNNETSPSSNVTTLQHGFVEPTAPSSSLDVANYDIAEVSGANDFFCARSYQGLVKCWGSNSQGRLGIGNQYVVGDNPGEMGEYQAFTDLGTELYATDITTGHNFACAVLNNTQVKCWGYGGNGQLGSSSSSSNYGDAANEMGDNLPYVRLSSSSSHLLSGIVKVDAGSRATCALSSDGQVYCWGYNDNYLVKSSGYAHTSFFAEHQTQLSRPAIDIAVGYYHACAILDNHQVQCWGRNTEGQLGTGNTTTPSSSVAQKERPYVDLGSDVGASDIMAGGHYTCAILTTEGTVCWGYGSQYRHGRNSTGNFITMGEELGNGTGSPYDTIAKSHRSSLSPDSPHTCIVDEMSEVQCWGATHVVPGSGGPSPQTVNVGGLVRSVVVSDTSACALRIDGNLICWGSNSNGQLGHGSSTHNYANSDGEIMIQNTDVRLWSPDTDFDGTINLWDDDDDDDGVLDINDDFSLDECASLDTDNDGMPNTIISSCSTTLVEDLDDDNDGWSDVNETNCDTNSISSLSVPIDTDSDGICNYIDSDDDGDGWSDVQENECEPNSFSTFRAFSTSDSHRYPSTSYSGELYFGGIESSELRYLGSSSSHSYTGMWRWTSNTATSDSLSTSTNNLGVMANHITLEHQDGITYWAGNQYQGSYVDTLTAGPRNGGTNYQNIFYQSSASSYESIISVDASNRMYVADGDDRLYFQTSSQANTSSFNTINLPNLNAYTRHHIAAQDNGTVHHLWWHSNSLKYTQSHVSSNGQSRIYDSTETIGTFTNLNTRSFDLEVDSNGIAHIAYYRNSASSFAVTYMNNSGGSFSSIGFEDFSPNQDGELDLDLDASDRVHLAWNDGTNNTVYHTLIDGSSSVTQQVTSHSNGIYYMSQAIDPKTNKSFILANTGSTSTISYPGSFISESLDSTLVPGDIDSDGICDNLETAPLIYSNPVFEAGMSASITPTFPGLQPTQIINTTPLPAGLTLDQSTGVISGTPSISNIAFSVTFNTTSAQENWTGTIEIKITPMAPLLVSADGFDGCGSNVWENQDIVYASDGTMYFVGNWNGASCNAYPTNIPGMENRSSFTNSHLLLSKRSANGTVLWVHAIQNAVTLKAVDLALDANDKPILLFQAAGNYYTEFDRSNNHNIPANSATQTAMILAQFDSDGQVIWKEFTKSIQSQTSHSLTSQNSETSLVVSPDGNITFSGNMLSGNSYHAASFGIGSGNNQINSSRNYCSNYEQPFIVRLDSTGTPLWVRIGNDNPASGSSSCTHHYARDLAVKSDGGVILATQTSGSVGFGSLYTKDNSYTSPAIFSFDSTGQPEWYQLVHASAAQIMGASIAVFDDDSVHVMVTPNVDDSGHGNIVLFYDTGITTSDPSYNSGWNTTKYSHSVHPWISAYDSRAWLLTARLNGNNGTPIWVDMNTEITNPGYSDGYGSRCSAPNRPSPVSYVLNNVAYTYVTDRCSSGTAHLSAYYRSSTIDNEEIHSVSSSTSSSDYEFGVVDFGPDSNDNPFILQRSDYTFYWGRYDSSSGFNHQTISGGSQPILYNIIGETGHQIQDNVPQVGIYTERRAASQVSPYGEFGQWSLIGINGSNWLPNGLSFNANTGVISGTPTTVTANGTYWLNYTVQGRTISSQITFGVSPTAPTLSYPSIPALERGNTMAPRTPTITGLNYLQSITITPALPLGLSFDTSNGTISGTPVNNMTSTQYSIVACNSWGVCGAATTITLVINEPLASPVWGGNNTLAFARDVTVRECPVTSGGGMVATWSISSTPSLPFGLAFNTTTGCFEGTPLLYSNAQSYTVTAQNSGGSTAVVVSINITGAGIGLTYPTGSLTLENGTAMQPIAGQTTGDNAQSWAISPSLPAGLYFGSTNGTIWGTPTASNNSASYTITVTSNSGVTASFSITIEILEPVEEIELTMPTGTVILVNGTPMQPLSGQTVGDAAVSWSISPSLPNGLEISVTNGTIWGTPTETSSLVVYTVTAVTASGESDSDTLSIMIQEDSDGDSIPDVVDTDDDNDGVLDGDEESGCEQNPDCDGDGTNDGDDAFPLDPSEDSDFDNDGIGDNADDDDDNDGWTETNETACGNHSDQDPLDYPTDTDGDGECDFTDTVDDREIAISYPVNVLDLTINQAMMTMSPTVTGGNVTSWSISPQLPNGLTFNETGVLSGTPSSNSSTISYVITASNGQYSTSTTLTITVYEVTGDADGDGIVDALDPDDDNDGWTDLDEADCNNTNSLDANDYPSDLDGDGLCDFNDNFRDLPLAMSYPSQTLELANGSEMMAYLPTVVGGDVATWEISGELPAGLSFGWSPARDASMDGSIRGTPTEEVPPTTYTIWANNSVSSASFDVTISVLKDTDTDGSPDIYDQDDDGDSWSDALEGLCGTDPLNVGDSPSDEDGDGICDALSTGPDMTDTDGDGVPDESDVFPNDPAAAFDNDNDGMPDDLFGFSTSNPRLIEDLDDDNDGWLDTREAECGSDRFDNLSLPIDSDQDGTCDGIDQDRDGDGFNNIVDDFPNDKGAFADLDNDGLPDDIDGSSSTGLVADTDDDGDNYTDQEEIECGSDPRDLSSVPLDSDGDGLCDAKESASSTIDDSNEEDGDVAFFISSRYWWCCILLLLLLLFLLIPLLGTNRKVVQLMKKGPEPPHTDSSPKFLEGKGTRKNPFVLASFTVPPGSTQVCSEKITVTDISPSYLVGMVDRMEFENGTRFRMLDVKDIDDLDENKPVNEIEVDEDGTIVVRFLFTDEEEPTMAGGSYDAILRLGSASVYFAWNVVVEGDPDYIAQQKAEEEARIAAAVKAKAEEEDAEAEAAKVKAEAEAEAAKVKAEAEAEAAKVKAEAEAEATKAKAEAEAAKMKAEVEAEAAKAKADAEAELAKVKAEAEEAKAKAEAEAEAQRVEAEKAKAEAEEAKAKAKAEAEEAKAKAKAEAEAQRVEAEKAKAEAEAEAAKLKAEAEEAKAKAKAEAEEAKAKAKAEAEEAKAKAKAEAEAEAAKAKAEAEAEAEAKRLAAEKAAADRIKQMEKEMEARRKRLESLDEKTRKKEEELLRVAEKAKSIDFGTLGVAASTKLKKKVEKNSTELEVGDTSQFSESGEAYISDVEGGSRISWKSKSGSKLMGVKGIKRVFAAAATVTARDDLQTIKGIGPFIEDKLHALGIFTFDQVGNMNSELEDTVNVAIEFFPGRIKRDEWAKQARKLAKKR